MAATSYRTAISGKWQLRPSPVPGSGYGFDEHCIWAQFTEYYPKGQRFTGLREPAGLPSRYWNPSVVKNGKFVETGIKDYGPDIYTDFLIDFIQRHRDRPFLAFYSMILPHNVLGVGATPTPGAVKPGDLKSGRYSDGCKYIDKLVGRIVKSIEQMNLRENTIIIFTTDNPRRYKNRATARGAHVPLVVSCPGRIKKREASNELVSLADLFPTLLDFAGVSLPPENEIDGKSLKRFLVGDTDTHRPYLYSYLGTAQMLRDKNWALEAVDPANGLPDGRFYRVGKKDGQDDYQEVTHSKDREVLEVRERFRKTLESIPHLELDDPQIKKILEKYNKRKHKHKLERRVFRRRRK